jgi:SAM-dependent methyltransferase
MLRLHSDNLDTGLLQNRLDALLDQGFRHAPQNQYPATSLPTESLRQRIRHWPWLRRGRNFASAWRLSGWSLRWLVRHTPVLGPLAWYLSGKLTLRAFRQHVLTELQTLGVAHQQLQAENRRAAAALTQTQTRLQQMEAALAEEVRQRQDAQARLAQTLSRLQPPATLMQTGADQAGRFAGWYLALENQYRGAQADIAARLAAYLPHLACAQVGQRDWPVLDLGCGRGEWLRLLARHQLQALGVDSNAAMLAAAREEGLQVIEADLIAFLRATDAGSIGAVTAFQVVEHLPPNVLLELFEQAFRVLRPGGVLLLETPNPENLQVAAYSFWLDPTHQRPIPPPLLAHSAAYFGFIDVTIERSNPWRDAPRLADASDAARHLEKLLYSDQDYALIARKPYVQDAAPAPADR